MIVAFVAAMVHIMICGTDIADMDTNLVKLFTDSANLEAGGLLGGYLGWVFCWAFGWVSYLILPFCLIILFFVLLEITPVQVWNKFKAASARRAERARLAAEEYDDEDDYEDDYEDEEPEEIPVPVKKNKKKVQKEQPDDDGYRVDPETGELIEIGKKPARKSKKARKAQEDDDDDIGFTPLKLTDDEIALKDDDSKIQKPEQELVAEPKPEPEPEPEPEEEPIDPGAPMEEIEVDLDDGFEQPAPRTHSRKAKKAEPEPEPEEEPEDMLDELLMDEGDAPGSELAGTEDVYVFPTTDMLAAGNASYHTSEEEVAANTEVLRQTLEDFHIRVKEVTCSTGPTVTRYEIKPEAGVRVRAIANLVDDIALGLAKSGVRIEAPIPGKAAVGIEVPNDKPATVYLRNLLESPEFVNHKSKVAVCLGADVSGKPVVFDIEKMPHLLVAGATGMGKSVCINCLVMSLLYKARPDEVKLIMVDPKKVEFTMYRDIPHLYCPIVSDPKKAAGALASAVAEMERRFSLIEEVGVRNITGYNEITKDDPEKEYLPRIVIIIDELADLMMTAPDDVETCICRLAQKARAAGIHIIIGTQRPSVDVVTGLIKANIPSRIAFTVSSQVDSRTIIDVGGAEKLIGRGDMLYAPVGSAKPQRVQGAFVADGEVERVVNFVKTQNGAAKYNDSFTQQIEEEAGKVGASGKKGGGADGDLGGGDGEDEKLWEAVEVVVTEGKASTSMLQRYLKVGYGRAAGLLDRMEELGFISAQDGNKPRRVLVTKQDLDELRMNGKAD
ncbi:MAG: DNA translocase FtsK [Clostridia bacterium]|nr:DNA translocase FtsK [Clostridia bacterium]